MTEDLSAFSSRASLLADTSFLLWLATHWNSDIQLHALLTAERQLKNINLHINFMEHAQIDKWIQGLHNLHNLQQSHLLLFVL